MNIQFFMSCLLRFIFVRSLLRHFHSNQVPDAPLAKDSLGVCISLWGTNCRWLYYSSISRVDGLSISSPVSCMKLLLDFRHFFGTVWPCSGCLVIAYLNIAGYGLVSFNCTPSCFVLQHFSLYQGEQCRLVDTSIRYYSAVDIL